MFAFACVVRKTHIVKRLREKLIQREFHLFEEFARVVFVYGRTFFFGNIKVAAWHYDLSRTFEPYYRKYTERAYKIFFAVFNDLTSYVIVNVFGD
jgi:hypothetical protein